jgi:hypothetical protein
MNFDKNKNLTRRMLLKGVAGTAVLSAYVSLDGRQTQKRIQSIKPITARAKYIWQPHAEPIAEPARLTSPNIARMSKFKRNCKRDLPPDRQK